MKAIVKNNNGFEDECSITKDGNKLIIEFTNKHDIVPYPLIRYAEFTVEVKPIEEEIGCCNDCNKCLTPIC